MSLTLIGTGKPGVIRFGPRDNPDCLRYWAERGLIHCEDARDNSYETLTVRDFLLRVKSINDMLGNSKAVLASEGFAHVDEIERQQRFVEESADLAERAKAQQAPPKLFSGKLYRHRFYANVSAGCGKYAF